jgi:molecular chaperone GrpE (heat shock protein)
MMKRREQPREFEITEQPHPITDTPHVEGQNLWQAAKDEVERLERRTAEAETSLSKIHKTHDAAKRKLLLNVIEDIMDNLDRIAAGTDGRQDDTAAQQWLKRFQRTRRTLEQLLAKEQVVPIDVVSAPPGVVTISEVEERDDVPDGTVVAVNWRGYLWKGEVLRKADVVIARNSHSNRETEGQDL